MIFNKIRFNKSYSIFSWGNTSAALGHKSDKKTPQKIEWPQQTGQKVHQIELGSSHSAIIDEQGKLFTFGSNNFGELGHNDGNKKTESIPREVQFFTKNDLKVKQVLCLNQSTIALTTDGDVWSWGYGGRNVNWITRLFYYNCGPLGHNNNEHRFCPTPIQSLRKQAKTKYLTGGNDFVISINKNNEIFNWGAGEYGCLGDGKNKPYLEPQKNEVLMNIGELEDRKELDKDQKLVSIKSLGEYSMGLDNRNQLWGWGGNTYGQIGTNVEVGVEMQETLMFPTKVHQDPLGGKILKDFQLGEDSLAILLEDGSVFWAGMRINYIFAQLPIPKEVKVKQIAASHRSIAVLSQDNQIYMKNNYVTHHNENIETGVLHADGHKLFNGNVIQIGGGYRNKYAIVEND